MNKVLLSALVIHVAAGAAHAQTFNDLQVRLGAYTSSTDGGEKPVGVWFSTGPVSVGKRTTSTFSVGETCDAFSVSSDGSLREQATAAWRIEITPTRVVRDAVTFKVRWQMAGFRQQAGRLEFSDDFPAPTDIELTLRPGESWPVYTLRNIHRYACGSASSIRVSVDNYPGEEDERRLVVADLWLVERLSNGGEAQRGQPVSVRGLPNRPSPFYFDRIVEAAVPLDIFGTLTTRFESGAVAVTVDTRCRWGNPQDSPRSYGPQKSVKSEIKMKPEETVEIRLPTLGERAGPFAKREYSIRIRARQLR